MQINLQQPARAKNTLTYLIEKFTETLAIIRVLKKLIGHLPVILKSSPVGHRFSFSYLVNYLQ